MQFSAKVSHAKIIPAFQFRKLVQKYTAQQI